MKNEEKKMVENLFRIYQQKNPKIYGNDVLNMCTYHQMSFHLHAEKNKNNKVSFGIIIDIVREKKPLGIHFNLLFKMNRRNAKIFYFVGCIF